MTSFWRNNDVSITSCVQGDVQASVVCPGTCGGIWPSFFIWVFRILQQSWESFSGDRYSWYSGPLSKLHNHHCQNIYWHLCMVCHCHQPTGSCYRGYERFLHSILMIFIPWRRQIETFSALLALYKGNSLVIGKFPSQRLVTRSFDVFFDLRLNTL